MSSYVSRRTLLEGGAALFGAAALGPPMQGSAVSSTAGASPLSNAGEPVRYKVVDGEELYLHRWVPASGAGPRPAVVFYHGRAWFLGRWVQFEQHAAYLASRGMMIFSVAYRLDGPVIATEDAVDAMNYVFDHAAELGVDTERIVAAGGSAGGHLGASTALLDVANIEPSHRPSALVLFNPVTDTTAGYPDGYGRNRFDSDEQALTYSLFHHIAPGAPRTLILHGSDDTTVHVQNSARFVATMREQVKDATVISHDREPHGFFNWLAAVYNVTRTRQSGRWTCSCSRWVTSGVRRASVPILISSSRTDLSATGDAAGVASMEPGCAWCAPTARCVEARRTWRSAMSPLPDRAHVGQGADWRAAAGERADAHFRHGGGVGRT